jgi:hypothetical protein
MARWQKNKILVCKFARVEGFIQPSGVLGLGRAIFKLRCAMMLGFSHIVMRLADKDRTGKHGNTAADDALSNGASADAK